jgi:hypothetical protein
MEASISGCGSQTIIIASASCLWSSNTSEFNLQLFFGEIIGVARQKDAVSLICWKLQFVRLLHLGNAAVAACRRICGFVRVRDNVCAVYTRVMLHLRHCMGNGSSNIILAPYSSRPAPSSRTSLFNDDRAMMCSEAAAS